MCSFVSTLLTAILSHHLGWVGTVAPLLTSSIPNAVHSSSSSNQNSNPSTLSQSNRTKISDISKSHPYSALWAQIGDLYGSIGSPPKMSKTIISGGQIQVMDKILNILTYFIRCGEITRNPKEKIIDKNIITTIMDNFDDHCLPTTVSSESTCVNVIQNNQNNNSKSNGMVRTATCLKDLKGLISDIDNSEFYGNNDCDDDDSSCSVEAINDEQVEDMIKIFKKNVMNDIPNVLVYRDSRFVKQELRIGNFLMDTGIEMNQKLKSDLKMYQMQNDKSESIKLTLTSPDNVEYSITTNNDDESLNLSNLIAENSLGLKNLTPNLPWDVPETEDDPDNKSSNRSLSPTDLVEFKRSRSLYTKSSNAKNPSHLVRRSKIVRRTSVSKIEQNNERVCSTASTLKQVPSLSDLITLNSLGNDKRLNWGVEPVKEPINFELMKHLEKLQKDVTFESTCTPSNSSLNGVVFVLGENEKLVDIHNSRKQTKQNTSRSYDNTQFENLTTQNSLLSTECSDSHESPQAAAQHVQHKMCKHKYKKHSGVKFNFEQYPQIATNYMKNKNLESNFNFHEKGFKIEQEMRLNYGASTSTLTSSKGNLKVDEDYDDECECCRSGSSGHFLTTPSNASELEFSCDLSDNNDLLSTPSNASELEFSCNANGTDESNNYKNAMKPSIQLSTVLTSVIDEHATKRNISGGTAEENGDKIKSNATLRIISIPMPKSKVQHVEKESCDSEISKNALVIFDPGFIPSLFIGITDHYIPDMILQVKF